MLPETKAALRGESFTLRLLQRLTSCFYLKIFYKLPFAAFNSLSFILFHVLVCVHGRWMQNIQWRVCLHQVIGWRSVTGAQFKAACIFSTLQSYTRCHANSYIYSVGVKLFPYKKIRTIWLATHSSAGVFELWFVPCLMMLLKI